MREHNCFDDEDLRVCPECGKEVPRADMVWSNDCHGIPFRLLCFNCYDHIMCENGYDGEYYDERDECLDCPEGW